MQKIKLEQLAHLVAGLVILIQVFSWFEKTDNNFTFYYLVGGCFFLVLAGAHKWVEKHFIRGEIAFFLLEAAAFLFAAWHSKEQGGKYVWLVFGAMGIAYVFLSVFTIAYIINSEAKHSRRRRRRRSSRSSARTRTASTGT
jgi:hypothetical protein